MKHYKPRSRKPIRNSLSNWFFTSPLGKHGMFYSRKECELVIAAIHEAHIARSDHSTHEGELLRAHFETEGLTA